MSNFLSRQHYLRKAKVLYLAFVDNNTTMYFFTQFWYRKYKNNHKFVHGHTWDRRRHDLVWVLNHKYKC